MNFNITTDALLRGPIWANAIDKVVGPMFETNWDLFALCISIGMFYDEQVDSSDMDSEDYKLEPRYIPRTVMLNERNKSLLDLMVQSSLLTSKYLSNKTEEERLIYAFDDDANIDIGCTLVMFLTKFANFGVKKINDLISDVDILETMDNMETYFENLYENGVNSIDKDIELE